MTISQQLLRAENARRIREVRPELAARVDLMTDEGLLAASREVTAESAEPKVLAVCVLREFELSAWIRETCAFARRVTGEEAAAWRHDFTRTVFLAGNPDNLRERFRFDHVAGDGSAAWLGPAPAEQSTALRRLLKLFPVGAVLPAVSGTTVRLPADGDAHGAAADMAAHGAAGGRVPTARELHLATAGLTLAQGLVHLHHLLAEAVLDGLLGPGDRLTVRPAPHLVGVAGPFAALRVGPSHRRPHELRAHAALGAARPL
ncbi:DUF6182 family protein [Streptomyces sp. AC512_CC834]|uniref:DUF6182 family protein n=1 Tax=Streptomyces sp. AC512_CC834 TaxID=2823691 RepID=UPI001C26678A|nr:DUF6182 family protein [Streptomyces sp. AC512_CC834]